MFEDSIYRTTAIYFGRMYAHIHRRPPLKLTKRKQLFFWTDNLDKAG
jgi:hypothetical protein